MTPAPLHDPLADPHAGAAHETRNTTCYMCACRCGIRVHLRDGKVRYIDGNPEHPINRGVICAKGASGIMKQYSPARLTVPLRRKQGAARGDGAPLALHLTPAAAGRSLAPRRARGSPFPHPPASLPRSPVRYRCTVGPTAATSSSTDAEARGWTPAT